MVCLDSSTLIDIIIGRPLNQILKDVLSENEILTVATPSIMEIFNGLHLEKNKKYVTEKEKSKIQEVLSSMNILDFDLESAIRAGEIEAELTNQGEIIEIEDVMIAAIAIRNKEKLLTKNKKHFERIKGLKIEIY